MQRNCRKLNSYAHFYLHVLRLVGGGLFCAFLLLSFTGQSQVMVSATGKPASLVICGEDGTFSMLVANTTGGTMSGASLTLDLPPGVRYTAGSVTGATEVNISNLNQPLFSLSDIPNNTPHAVTYDAGLICGYSNTQNFNYIVTYNGTDYTGYETPLQNFYYPEPVITSITNGTVSIPVNTTVTRGITIQQQGLGSSLDTLILLDQHTSDIQVLSVSLGTLHPYIGPGPMAVDTIILTGSDFPGGNGLFDQGEQIVVDETVKLVGCTNGQSTLKASWGCFGEICSYYAAFPTVSPAAGNTVVAMAFTANRRGWGFIDNSGWVEFTVSNNGTGAGTAFDLTVLSGFSSGGSTYYPNSDWINEIDSFSVNGNYLLSFYNYAAGALNGQYAYYTTLQFPFDPDGPGVGLEDMDGDGFFDDLPPGRTITIKAHTYYDWPEAISRIAHNKTCGSGWTASAYQAFRYGFHYKSQCLVPSGVNWLPNSTVLMFQTYDTKTVQHTIPPDLYDGVTEWMEQLVTTGTNVTADGCPDDSVYYKVVLPKGVVAGTGTATFKGVSMGSPLVTGDTLYYKLERSRVLSGGLFRVPVMLDCELGHASTGFIQTQLRFWCDYLNYPDRFFTYWCSTSPVFGLQCPISSCNDPSISNFSVRRTTLGWKNNLLTQKVSPGDPGLKLTNALSRDTIRIEAAGVINGTVDSVYFRIQHDAPGGSWGNRLFFDYISDTLWFFDSETETWDTCVNLFPVVTNGTTSSLVTYFGDLTKPGQCLEGKSFTKGDSISYVIIGQVKNVTQSQWRTVPALRARFYWTDTNKPLYCNDRGFTFNVLGSNYNFNTSTFYQQIVLNGCTSFLYEGLISMSMDDCGGDIAFPAEIRPFLVLDTMRFTLPEGFAYQPGTARHSYNVDYQFSYLTEVIPDPIISIGPAGTVLTFVRTPAWNYSDFYDCYEDLERITFHAIPSCKATTNYNYSATSSGRYQFCIDGSGIRRSSSMTKAISYTAPLVSLTNLITTAEGRQDTVLWKIRLCNVRGFDATNNWVGFESPSAGITVVSLYDITNPGSPLPVPLSSYGPGKYWGQTGSLTPSECRTYEVKAVYSSCSFDSVFVRHGYNCASYPVNPELGYPPSAYSCMENSSKLYLDPKDVSLNLAVASPLNPVNLCNPLDYEAEVTNTQLSYGYDLKFMVTMPPGINVTNGSSQFSFPYPSGTWVAIGDPINEPVGSNQWVWHLSAEPNAVATLKGVDSIPKNGYRIRFQTMTDCDFISGTSILMTALASNACGEEKSRSAYSSDILIDGLPTNENLYVLSTNAPPAFETCGDPMPVRTKIINLGPASVSNIEELSVVIDDAFDYVAGSLNPIHNGPSGIAANTITGGIRYIYFQIEPNLPVGDSIVFTFELEDVDPAGVECDTIPLTTNSLLVASVPCASAPGGVCSIHAITESVTSQKGILKDNLGFVTASVTSVPFGMTGETVTVQYQIENSGAENLRTTTANVVFLSDANGNGIPDETGLDSLYFHTLDVSGLPPGGRVNGTAVFFVPADKLCLLMAALRLSDNPCTCGDDVVMLNPVRLFNAGPDQSVCQYDTIQIGTPGISGYSYTWIPSLYLSDPAVSDPMFTFQSLLGTPVTLPYFIQTTRPGNCFSRDTVLITVLPRCNAFAGEDTVICEGSSVLLDRAVATNASTILWYTMGTGNFSDASLQNPVYNPGPEDILNGSVALAMTAVGIEACGVDTDFVTLSFSRYPLVYAGKDSTICANWSYLNPDATVQYYSGLQWSTTGDGIFNNDLMLRPTYASGPADQAAGSVYLVLTVTGLASCPVVDDTVLLTLTPPPVVTTSPLAQTICSEDQTFITLTANQPGAAFTWSGSLTSGSVTGFSSGNGNPIEDPLVNHDTTTGVVTYSITPATGGCIGSPVNYVVQVRPLPNVTTQPADTSLCSGEPTNILLQSDLNFVTYSWTALGSSPDISGFSDATGPVITDTLANSGMTTGFVTYTVVAEKNGCAGPPFPYTVYVLPIPDVIFLQPTPEICSGQSTNITLGSGVTGATFSWTCEASSPDITGENPGNGFVIDQILQNSGTTTETVTYTVTPLAEGCEGTAEEIMVTVFPTPIAVPDPTVQLFCSGTPVEVALSSAVPGCSFTWTATATSGDVAGYSDGSGAFIQDTITNSGFETDTVIYLITPLANGCPGLPISAYAIVKPIPDVSNPSLASQICSGTSPNILLSSHVEGTGFSWTATGSSGNVYGFGPGSGTLITDTIYNSGLNIETVTYFITPAAEGCDGPLTEFVVTVVSVPDVFFVPAVPSVCSGQVTSVSVQSSVTGATFSWTASGSSGNVSGFGPGSGDMILDTLVNIGVVPESVTYSVYPEAFGCPPGPPGTLVITVFPTASVTNFQRHFEICSPGITNIVPESDVTVSAFSWTATASSTDILGYTDGSGTVISQLLSNTGDVTGNVTYIVTPEAYGCPGDTGHFSVDVFPVPGVIFSPPVPSVCSETLCTIGLSSNVTGASFSWTATGTPGIGGYTPGAGDTIRDRLTNTALVPGTATYSVLPAANGCNGSLTPVLVTVNPLPQVRFTPCFDTITTTEGQPFRLKGGIPLNGTYTGTGITANVFDPLAAGPGAHSVNYSYANTYSCSDTVGRVIHVLDAPVWSCGSDFADARDARSYPTIQIGGQCWMASNLDYGTLVNGLGNQRDNCISEKFCQGNLPANCALNGGLYQWDEVMGYREAPSAQGLCPPGWHIPSEGDWTILFTHFGSSAFAGSPLLFSGFSGFNAMLSGNRFNNVNWNFMDFATLFWTSTPHGPKKAWAHGMNEYNSSVSSYPSNRNHGMSVRCIRD